MSWLFPERTNLWRNLDEIQEAQREIREFQQKRVDENDRIARAELAKRLEAEQEITRLKAELNKLKPRLHCTFCAKSQDEVKTLIAGHAALICNECIALCAEIVSEEAKAS